MGTMTLRGKFLITLSLGAVAVLAVFIFALQSVSTIDGTFSRIRQVDLSGKVAALDVAKDVNYLSRLTRNMMLGGDFDKDMKQFQDTSASIEKKFVELAALDFTPEEKKLIRTAHTAATQFSMSGYELMSPLKELPVDQRHTAYKAYEKSATPAAMAFREAFGTFEKAMNARFDRAVVGMQEDIAVKKRLMWAVLIVSVIAMYGLGYLFTNRDLRVMNTCVQFAGELGGGDLARRLDTGGCASLTQLAKALNATADSLSVFRAEVAAATQEATKERDEAKQALAEARDAKAQAERARAEGMLHAAHRLEEAVDIVSDATRELSGQVARSGNDSREQARRVDETSAAIGEMNATVMDVARNASQAAQTAEQARHKAMDGSQIVSEVIQSIGEVQKQALGLKSDMSELGGQAEGIGRVMAVIADIADQTNLLALNAAIEAARAGDAGRGFAVVADEVRKLAEKTMTATKEVGDAIHGIQQGTRKNVENVERAVRIIDSATGLATTSGQALRDIVELVDHTTDQVRSIASASEEQSAASEQISRSIVEVSQLSASTAEAMRHSTRAVEQLGGQTRVLKEMIDHMKADEGAAGGVRALA